AMRPGVRIGIYEGARGNMDEGWTRYVFDTFNVPYKSVRDEVINQADLRNDFDALILPSEQVRAPSFDSEFQGDTARGLSDRGYVQLARFVEGGGTLVCFDQACGPLIAHLKLPLRNALEGLRSSDFYCPGSILRIDVDTSHPIARSMSKETDAYFINSSAFEEVSSGKGVHVVARYARNNVLRSGWLRGEDKVKDKIALAEVGMGKGRIVLFAFRPQHRGQTWGTFPFIWNAINSGANR